MLRRLIEISLIALLCTACHSASTSQSFSELYLPRHAKGFVIEYDSLRRCEVLRIRNPYQSSRQYEQTVALNRNTERIAVLSSSFAAMLEAIGEEERIVGVSGVQYIVSPAIRQRIDEQKIVEIGHESSMRFEVLKSLDVDIVLLYGLYGEDTSLTSKLQQLDIPYVYIGDYTESTPLGKAEWCVAIAALCQCREQGEEYFRTIEERYERLRDSIRQSMQGRPRPQVMLNMPYRDTWFMPPTESYFVRLIEDGGGEYLYRQNQSRESVPISIEEALLIAHRADVWLNVGQCNTLDELRQTLPRFADVKAVKNRRIYNNNRRQGISGGSDFWESGAVRPDVVLNDIAKLLCNEDCNEELYYYKQLR